MMSVSADLPVLEALAEDPSLSQRELARRAGLSLSRAHFVLRRLVEKGLVKVQSAAQSEHKLGYLYLLTPTGIEAKAKLTYAFMTHTAQQYQRMSAHVARALEPALRGHGTKPLRVCVVGSGALSEVVKDLVGLRADSIIELDTDRANVLVVTDPELELPNDPRITLVRLA